MSSLARASLYERVGTGCAPRAKQSGRGIASSISSGDYASSDNWRQLLDGEGVRMRLLSMLVGGRREHVLVGRSPPARSEQHGVSSFAGAGSRNCWAAVACQCAREGNMVECGREGSKRQSSWNGGPRFGWLGGATVDCWLRSLCPAPTHRPADPSSSPNTFPHAAYILPPTHPIIC
jgi:hypothetical protein